ncbi:MAG: ATP-binding cassette domain-containing protein [Actinomycetia bacterium]|nr:ATP-binding cassette domain-containing protein [Actinomycetes bacterium]
MALDGVNLLLSPGEVVSLTGASGSGKSTLMHCMAGLVTPDSGGIVWDGQDIAVWSAEDRAKLRRERLGFVFQFGDLVAELSLLENVCLPLLLTGQKMRKAKVAASEILELLGLTDEQLRRPDQVSGGQAQRAAVARALVNQPDFVFADEPTGSLDSSNAILVLDAFISAASAVNAGVLLVTHDPDVASHADRRVKMADGRVV